MVISKSYKKVIGVLVPAFVATGASAAGPDVSAMVTSVDFGTVTIGIVAVATALGGVYVAFRGVGLILERIKGR
jgi:hypothetical protein